MEEKTYYLVKRNENSTPLDPTIPFYIEDISGQQSTLSVNTSYSNATNIEYSTDNETWSSTKPDIPANGRVYIRANATYWGIDSYASRTGWKFNSSNNFNAGGNTMSLLYGSNFTGSETSFPDSTTFCLSGLLGNSKIVSAENLIFPATTLNNSCYSEAFKTCQSLTTAPRILPATTLANNCYDMMFCECYSLTTAPQLPATTLVSRCYSRMFEKCYSLTTAPTLPATTLTYDCYSSMFRDCSSLKEIIVKAPSWINQSDWVSGVSFKGYFAKPTNTSISTGTGGIPSGWTVVNY